jgi:hypothetical protein
VADRGADLEYAVQGATVSDTGLADEVLEALDAVARAAPTPPKRVIDAAMDTYLHSCAHRSREPSEHFSPRRGRLTLWQRVGFTSC